MTTSIAPSTEDMDEDIEQIVEVSIANMDAGRLSEPINGELDHYLEMLADELEEDEG